MFGCTVFFQLHNAILSWSRYVHTILLLFSLMEKQFWVTSWELEGHHTSFHRKDVHPYVTRHLPPATLRDKCVFVPLCGKTLDLLYFRQYAHQVVGVELVEKAVLQFFGHCYRSIDKVPFFLARNSKTACSSMCLHLL